MEKRRRTKERKEKKKRKKKTTTGHVANPMTSHSSSSIRYADDIIPADPRRAVHTRDGVWGFGSTVPATVPATLLCHVLCYCILAFWLPRLWGTDGVLVLILLSLILLLGSMSRWMRSSQSTTAYRIDRMTKRVALCVPLCQREHPRSEWLVGVKS